MNTKISLSLSQIVGLLLPYGKKKGLIRSTKCLANYKRTRNLAKFIGISINNKTCSYFGQVARLTRYLEWNSDNFGITDSCRISPNTCDQMFFFLCMFTQSIVEVRTARSVKRGSLDHLLTRTRARESVPMYH